MANKTKARRELEAFVSTLTDETQKQFRVKHKKQFLRLLAEYIQDEAEDNPDDETPEPYRAAGDRLVDQALLHID